jgi:hypothetical protein
MKHVRTLVGGLSGRHFRFDAVERRNMLVPVNRHNATMNSCSRKEFIAALGLGAAAGQTGCPRVIILVLAVRVALQPGDQWI